MKNIIHILFLSILFSSNINCQNQKELALKETKDISYLDASKVTNDSLQRLNLVIPQGVDSFPLLIWIGGGAWSYVNRDMEMDLARQIAKEGIAVASVGHRLSSAVWKDSTLNEGVQHPEHIKDVAAAFKWLYDHAETYGYDHDRIYIGGFSSGAHLAALISLDDRYLKEVGLNLSNIKGYIPIGGTYDVSDYHQAFLNGTRKHLADEHVKAVFGPTEAHFLDASPTNYLDNLGIPLLLISDMNMFNYTQIFEDAIRETEFRNFQTIYVHRLSHGDLWRHMSKEKHSLYRDLVCDFVLNGF